MRSAVPRALANTEVHSAAAQKCKPDAWDQDWIGNIEDCHIFHFSWDFQCYIVDKVAGCH